MTLPLVAAGRARAPRCSSSPRCWARSPPRWCSAFPTASTSSPRRSTSSSRNIRRALPLRRGDGRVAVRRHVRDAVPLSPASSAGGSYVTITGKAFRPRVDGRRAAALAAVRRLRASTFSLAVVLPIADAGLRLVAALRHRHSRPAPQFTLANYQTALSAGCRCARRSATACCSGVGTASVGVVLMG